MKELKMKSEEKLEIMRVLYTGLQAESLMRYAKADIFDEIAEERIGLSLASGIRSIQMLNVKNPADAFTRPASVVECASWKITEIDDSLIAVCNGCKLVDICKKMGTPSPCNIYCLSPIEGMIKALKAEASFQVKSTLYDSNNCTVKVSW
jgi:hypothetical protein